MGLVRYRFRARRNTRGSNLRATLHRKTQTAGPRRAVTQRPREAADLLEHPDQCTPAATYGAITPLLVGSDLAEVERFR